VQGDAPDSAFFSELVPALHALSTDAAKVAARAMQQRGPGPTRKILDVAGGSAGWSLAMAAEDPRAEVTLIDQPEVLDRVTRKFVERDGCSNRFTFRPGNLAR
jgi:ubiquinone/menaquinone biosynthesis C-methylase UbiE